MKRYGIKQMTQGTRIKYSSVERIYNESPKVIDYEYGENIGYITYDLFIKLINDKKLVKIMGMLNILLFNTDSNGKMPL